MYILFQNNNNNNYNNSLKEIHIKTLKGCLLATLHLNVRKREVDMYIKIP